MLLICPDTHRQSWEYDKLMIVHFTSLTRARNVLASRHIALQPTSGFLGDGGADCLVSIMLLSSAKKNGDPKFPRMLSTEWRCSPTIVRFVSDRGHLDVYNIFEAQHTILNSILPVHICSKCMKTMGRGPRGPKSCDLGRKDQSQVPSTPSALTGQGCSLVCLVKGKRRKFGAVISEGVANAKTGCWMLSTELNINGNGSV